MNISKPTPTKEPASPRPPAVGEEVKFFHDPQLEPTLRTMEQDLKECHKSSTEAYNSSNPSPPPAYRWAQSLHCLLDDTQGVQLFREFLTQEGHETKSLDFRFGAIGLKKQTIHKKKKTIHNILYERMVIRIPSISQGVKDDIKSKLSSGVGVDDNMFDEAIQEVEAYMLKTTYPNFLKSDLYIQHLQQNKEREYEEEQLPTLHEDKEFNFSHQIKKFYARGGQRQQRSQFGKGRPEIQPGYLKSPAAPYHVQYAPCLPASARDSETQSMSSNQTDDTMSLPDSSVAEYPMLRNKFSKKSKFPTIIMNSDNFSPNNFIPRTQLPPPSEAINHEKPEEFAAILTKKLIKLQEQNKQEQKLMEKLNAPELNDSIKSDSAPPQKFLPFAPEEDNNQAILDNHISMVFEETPTRSPACATPPTAKLLEECSRIAAPRPEFSQDLSYSRSLRLPSSFYGSLPGGRMRQDPDTRSNDSGALSEDNLPQCHIKSDLDSVSYDRRNRDKPKNKKLSNLFGSSSTCFDSGVSTTCESSVHQPTHQRVATWLESKVESENERQGRTSPVPSRSSSSRRACSSSRGGYIEMGGAWPPGFMPDPSVLPPPDIASNLREAKRILEDEARARMGKSKYISSGRSSHDAARGKFSSRACDTIEDGISHRKQSKKSSFGDGVASSSESTIIGYSFGRDSVPYKTKIAGKNITLRQFKAHLNKRGNFRYFFKRLNDDFGTKVVMDEVSDDYEILPLWEGKVFCVIEAMDDGALMNDD